MEDFTPFNDDNESEELFDNMEDIDLHDDNIFEVKQMIAVKRELDNHSNDWNSNEYKEIVEKINQYLLKYCDHDKDTDLFDITPEKSMTVCYCKKCYCVFTPSHIRTTKPLNTSSNS